MAGDRCTRSMAERWARSTASTTSKNEMAGPGHQLVLSGDVMWCLTCGRYVDAKAVGSKEQCKGVPRWDGSYGGAWGQLRKLRSGIHPHTGKALQTAVDLEGRSIEQVKKATGTYSRLPVYRKETGKSHKHDEEMAARKQSYGSGRCNETRKEVSNDDSRKQGRNAQPKPRISENG